MIMSAPTVSELARIESVAEQFAQVTGGGLLAQRACRDEMLAAAAETYAKANAGDKFDVRKLRSGDFCLPSLWPALSARLATLSHPFPMVNGSRCIAALSRSEIGRTIRWAISDFVLPANCFKSLR